MQPDPLIRGIVDSARKIVTLEEVLGGRLKSIDRQKAIVIPSGNPMYELVEWYQGFLSEYSQRVKPDVDRVLWKYYTEMSSNGNEG